MGTTAKQANFVIPEDILDDLRKHVARRQQSRFVAEALRKELKRLRLETALEESFGAWKDKDHPEFMEGAEEYVRKTRKSSRLTGKQ
ncbi:MAG: hypothetical protein FD174_3584 [Geobacteraceae bacterium]|nr:MAG: hypothetical protein FD174_3584 [Geobacteraceae bacterium]